MEAAVKGAMPGGTTGAWCKAGRVQPTRKIMINHPNDILMQANDLTKKMIQGPI
jgi:hypothetical protein